MWQLQFRERWQVPNLWTSTLYRIQCQIYSSAPRINGNKSGPNPDLLSAHITDPTESLGSITLCSKLRSLRDSWWQCPGRFPSIVGVMWDIFRLFFTKLGCILSILLKWLVVFLESWTSPSYFSHSTGSSVTSSWFSPFIAQWHIFCHHRSRMKPETTKIL